MCQTGLWSPLERVNPRSPIIAIWHYDVHKLRRPKLLGVDKKFTETKALLLHVKHLTEIVNPNETRPGPGQASGSRKRWRFDSTSWYHLATDEQRDTFPLDSHSQAPLKEQLLPGWCLSGSRRRCYCCCCCCFPSPLHPSRVAIRPGSRSETRDIAGSWLSAGPLWTCCGWHRCWRSHSCCGPAARLLFISKSSFMWHGWCVWPWLRSLCAYWKAEAETLKTWGEFVFFFLHHCRRLTASRR